MNLPNKLTMSRLILSLPTAYTLLMARDGEWLMWFISLALFSAASLTDAFDGSIARKRGLVTNFGKLLDPVADKVLVTSVFSCLTAMGMCSPWVLIIVLTREFLVMSIRMVAAGEGIIIPANKWGKAKTITQMTAIITIYAIKLFEAVFPAAAAYVPRLGQVGTAMLWISAAITVVSGVIYCINSKQLFRDIK